MTEPLHQNRPPLNPNHREVADLLGRLAGFRFETTMASRLDRCLRERASALGETEDAYVARLRVDPEARQQLLDRLTVQETSFFRDPGQLEAFRDHVLAGLPPSSTVWSAGCATGQEPYTLAMLFVEGGRDDLRVVATDVSTAALARAADARYVDRELRGLSPERRERFFSRVGDSWTPLPTVRSRVSFAHHNLITDAPPVPAGACPVVFCRNVLIYFRPDGLRRAVDVLTDAVRPGGHLFAGFSESLWQVTDRLRLVRVGQSFAYLRPARPTAPSGPLPPTGAAPRRPAGPGHDRRSVPAPGTTGAALPSVDELLARGEAATARGDHGGAATSFRAAAYLDGDQPLVHLRLGLALEQSGDPGGARRAFAASRSALRRCDADRLSAELGGHSVDELALLLERKLRGGG